ncbi:hypothetical protein IM737_16790 [Devosia sp. SL43]|nr:hypothetical protein IM737_16790 [Devosia sp. SL43]
MVRVVFAGPSIYGLDLDFTGLHLLPPASRGDIASVVRQGATHIGLIDGYFGWVASVWHKEILFALESGVTVMGAASMGALRAADCAGFGMVPVGRIANWYLDGTLDDDGDVAIIHAPPELGYAPLTEALVDARATLEQLMQLGLLGDGEYHALSRRAEALNFRERTREALAAALPEARRVAVLQAYTAHHRSLKQEDARLLVDRLRSSENAQATVPHWKMAESFTWKSSGL